MTPDPRDAIGEQLSAYLDGEGTPEERAAVEALLAVDTEARVLLAELQSAAAALGGLPRTSAPPEVYEAIAARIERDTLLADADEPVRLARHKRRPLRSLVAAAAMLVIAVGGGLYVSSELARTTSEDVSLALHAPATAPGGTGLPPMAESSRLRKVTDYEKSTVLGSGAAENGYDQNAVAGGPEPEPHSAMELRDLDTVIAVLSKPAAEAPMEALTDRAAGVAGANMEADAPGTAFAPDETRLARAGGGEDQALRSEARLRSGADFVQQANESTDAQFGLSRRVRADRGVSAEPKDPPKIAGDGRTLERKLTESPDRVTVLNHPFENEPVRLTLHSGTLAEQAELIVRLEQFLQRWQAAPLAHVWPADPVTSPGSPPTGALVARVHREAAPPAARLWYYQGVAGVNFSADAAGTQQIIARIWPEALPAIISRVAAPQVQATQLAVGGLTADGGAAAAALARRTVALPVAGSLAAAPAHQDLPDDLIGWLDLLGYSPSPPEVGPLLARREQTNHDQALPRRGRQKRQREAAKDSAVDGSRRGDQGEAEAVGDAELALAFATITEGEDKQTPPVALPSTTAGLPVTRSQDPTPRAPASPARPPVTAREQTTERPQESLFTPHRRPITVVIEVVVDPVASSLPSAAPSAAQTQPAAMPQ